MEETLLSQVKVALGLHPKKCYVGSTQYAISQSEFDVFSAAF